MEACKEQRIAIPLLNGKPCPRFCQAGSFLVAHLMGSSIGHLNFLDVPPCAAAQWPDWLAEFKITDVIAGSLREETRMLLQKNNIQISDWQTVDGLPEIIHHFLDTNAA